TLAEDDDVDRLADRALGNDARQVAHLANFLAVEAQDDVARLDRAVVDRSTLDDTGHQRAAGTVEADAFSNLVRHRLNAHAEPAPSSLAKFAQLADDANRKLRRDREANADRATRGRDDRRIDADDLAVHVEQRATRITAVDRGVSLDEVVIRAGINVAAARRDNAD